MRCRSFGPRPLEPIRPGNQSTLHVHATFQSHVHISPLDNFCMWSSQRLLRTTRQGIRHTLCCSFRRTLRGKSCRPRLRWSVRGHRLRWLPRGTMYTRLGPGQTGTIPRGSSCIEVPFGSSGPGMCLRGSSHMARRCLVLGTCLRHMGTRSCIVLLFPCWCHWS